MANSVSQVICLLLEIPIHQNLFWSDSSKMLQIRCFEQNNHKARLFDGQRPQSFYFDLLLGIFCSHWSNFWAWSKSLALWLYAPNGESVTIFDECDQSFLIDVKCRFDECDFPWNGVTTVLHLPFSLA